MTPPGSPRSRPSRQEASASPAGALTCLRAGQCWSTWQAPASTSRRWRGSAASAYALGHHGKGLEERMPRHSRWGQAAGRGPDGHHRESPASCVSRLRPGCCFPSERFTGSHFLPIASALGSLTAAGGTCSAGLCSSGLPRRFTPLQGATPWMLVWDRMPWCPAVARRQGTVCCRSG